MHTSAPSLVHAPRRVRSSALKSEHVRLRMSQPTQPWLAWQSWLG